MLNITLPCDCCSGKVLGGNRLNSFKNNGCTNKVKANNPISDGPVLLLFLVSLLVLFVVLIRHTGPDRLE